MVDVTPLSLAEAIRRRPGMYVGDLDPHPLLWEFLARYVDIELGGRPLSIIVELHEDGSVAVTDDGPGIPVPLEQLLVHGHVVDGHARSMFLLHQDDWFVCVNALSERVDVRTRRGPAMVRQCFSRGVAISKEIVEAEPPTFGTQVRFWPDPELFGRFQFNLDLIERRLLALVALRSSISCRLLVERRLDASLDIASLLPNLPNRTALHEVAILGEVREHVSAQIALRWYARNPWEKPELRSYCNLLETRSGTHVDGLAHGIGAAVASMAAAQFGTWRLAYERVEPCLAAVVAVEILEPEWTGCTKDNLKNAALEPLVTEVVLAELPAWFERHPNVLAAIS